MVLMKIPQHTHRRVFGACTYQIAIKNNRSGSDLHRSTDVFHFFRGYWELPIMSRCLHGFSIEIFFANKINVNVLSLDTLSDLVYDFSA